MSDIDVHNPLSWNCTSPGCGALAGQPCNWHGMSSEGEEFHPERREAAVPNGMEVPGAVHISEKQYRQAAEAAMEGCA